MVERRYCKEDCVPLLSLRTQADTAAGAAVVVRVRCAGAACPSQAGGPARKTGCCCSGGPAIGAHSAVLQGRPGGPQATVHRPAGSLAPKLGKQKAAAPGWPKAAAWFLSLVLRGWYSGGIRGPRSSAREEMRFVAASFPAPKNPRRLCKLWIALLPGRRRG